MTGYDFYQTEVSKRQLKFLPSLHALFPKGAPVRLEVGVTGQKVMDDHMILGFRAGPSIDVGHVLHEIAHLVEIDDGRAGAPGWGLWYTQVEILGRTYDQPETYNGVLREARTIAWQRRLGQAIGFNLNMNEFIRPLHFLTDFTMVPHRKDGTIKEWDQDRYRLIRAYVVDCLKSYTVEAAKAELGRKCEVLQDAFRGGRS